MSTKTNWPTRKYTIHRPAEYFEDLHSEDHTEQLATMFGFTMIISPDFEPLEDGRWTKSESEVHE